MWITMYYSRCGFRGCPSEMIGVRERVHSLLSRGWSARDDIPFPFHHKEDNPYNNLLDISVGVAGRNHANLINLSWRGGAEEAIYVIVVESGCGQEEPGNIMRVQLATLNKVN